MEQTDTDVFHETAEIDEIVSDVNHTNHGNELEFDLQTSEERLLKQSCNVDNPKQYDA